MIEIAHEASCDLDEDCTCPAGVKVDRELRRQSLEAACRTILTAVGENPMRPGLADTPARFARFWLEFLDYSDERIGTTFEIEQTTVDQMVVVSGMRVWSLCEHHLLPFWCDVAIGYVPRVKLLGLSKFGRVARLCGRRLQTQERLVSQIADTVADLVETQDVAVVAEGEHLCMTMRGVAMPSRMSTDVMGGVFRHNESARSEFMRRAQARPR